jgi:glycosyltransferase involved in cell wall biosynthesis
MMLWVEYPGTAVAETLLVPLAARSGEGADAVRRLLDCEQPVVFPLAQLADGGRRVLRDRRYDRLAIAGAPPSDELGYGLTPLVALLGRPRDVALVDLESQEVTSVPLRRYIARSAPLALGQLAGSTLLISTQRLAIPLARHLPRPSAGGRKQLERLVYLLPAVGSGSEVGGSVTHSHEVIRALRAEGVTVTAFTTSSAIARTARNERDAPVDWRQVRIPRAAKAIAASAAAGADLALVRAALPAARDADAIYQRHGRFTLAGAILAGLTRKPLILEFNGSEEFVERHWMSSRTPLRGRIKLCEDAALAAAARIVVVSEVDRRSLLERGIPADRLVLNPNGVDPERFAVGGGSEIRQRHGIADDAVVFGFLGSFGPWHGAPLLARAFVDAAGQVPAAHLLLLGDGREQEETVAIVRDAGLERRLTVAGKVASTEVPAHLDACDVLVSPHVPLAGGAEFFGSPTKLFEYMAAGKPIVASRLGQIGDVLEHGATGWLVRPGDADDLREGLLAVAADAELRHMLGANARRQAVERHTWRLNARRVIDAYAALAGEGS